MRDVRVGIVGSGVAGLLAARTLQDRGVHVELFDKGRRPGGRASSRVKDGKRFDYALSSVLVYDETPDPLRRYLDAWERTGLMARWDPKLVTITGPQNEVAPLDVGDYRLVFCPNAEHVATVLASRRHDSLAAFSLEEAPRADDALTIHSETLVDRVEDGSIFSEGRQLGTFDHIVLAVPPENLDRILPYGDGEPPSAGIRMRPLWTVMLTLKKPIEAPGDNLAYREHPQLCKATNETAKPGRPSTPCWVIHSNEDWAEANIDRDRDAIASDLIAAFLKSVGAHDSDVESAVAHRWRYALRPDTGEEPLSQVRQRAASHGVVVAGDWTDDSGRVSEGTPGWYGFENAFASGLRAADAVIGAVEA